MAYLEGLHGRSYLPAVRSAYKLHRSIVASSLHVCPAHHSACIYAATTAAAVPYVPPPSAVSTVWSMQGTSTPSPVPPIPAHLQGTPPNPTHRHRPIHPTNPPLQAPRVKPCLAPAPVSALPPSPRVAVVGGDARIPSAPSTPSQSCKIAVLVGRLTLSPISSIVAVRTAGHGPQPFQPFQRH